MSTQSLSVVIVDDEPLARRHLRGIVASDPELSVVGEYGDGREALAGMIQLEPDIALLDVQMPELDGLGVLSAFPGERMPAVIFVTAYNEYAVKAFEVHALDYVLKPVSRERLTLALSRAKRRVRESAQSMASEEIKRLAREIGAAARAPRIVIKVDGKHVFLDAESIHWIEAVDDYVRFHVGSTSYLVRGTLQSYAERLPPAFLRVHRSAIINTDQVRDVSTNPQGDYRLTLRDGTRLPSGRSYRGVVGAFIDRLEAGRH